MLFVGGVVNSREIAWFRFLFSGAVVITAGTVVITAGSKGSRGSRGSRGSSGVGKGGKGARSKGRGNATRDKIDEPMT